MKFYFFYFQVPELGGLKPRQRKAVYQCAFEAFLAEQPTTIWVCTWWFFAALVGGAVAGWLAVAGGHFTQAVSPNGKLLAAGAGGLAGAMVFTFVSAHWMNSRLRPYFRRVLEERRDEIQQINKPN
jgi:hypothetical protein